jgi:hypothetical protein
MPRCVRLAAVLLLLSCASYRAVAQDVLVPAGTLLRCTMNEPNFSSATAQVGDPVLCHLGSVQEFGRNAFPRGAYMSGHLEADKEPGHFIGKGYMKVVFDRIGTPNADVTVDTKVIAARGYKVDKEGAIKGKGHATRDVVEWMIPVLWPWKVLMLPARGPRPTLKGEQTLTLRLMEDVTIPRAGAAYNSRDWRPPHAQLREQPSAYHPRETMPLSTPGAKSAGYVVSVDPAFKEASETIEQRPAAASQPALPSIAATGESRRPTSSLTLIALRNEIIYAVSDYWLAGDRLDYVLPSGSRDSCVLNDVDLARTTQLNSERGISVTFHDLPPHQPSL